MSELDGLVSRDGVLVAGRFGPDWRVAETKSRGLFIEYPAALGVMDSFCEAVQSVFNALAVAMAGLSLVLDSRPWLGCFWRQLLYCRSW